MYYPFMDVLSIVTNSHAQSFLRRRFMVEIFYTEVHDPMCYVKPGVSTVFLLRTRCWKISKGQATLCNDHIET